MVVISETAVNKIIFCLSKFSKFKTKSASVKIQTQIKVSAIKLPISAKLISLGSTKEKHIKVNL